MKFNFRVLIRTLNGRGHLTYRSKRAKEEFAKNLMSMGEKIMLAGVLPLLGYMLNPSSINLVLSLTTSGVFVWGGLSLRHEALKTYDDIEMNRLTVVDARADASQETPSK